MVVVVVVVDVVVVVVVVDVVVDCGGCVQESWPRISLMLKA